MTITKNSARQEIVSAYVDFTFAQIPTTATAYAALDLPVGAIVVGGDVTVTVAWDTATSAVLDVGDVTTANRYANDVNLKALGRTALVPTGFIHTSVENVLKVLPVYVSTAATVGAARLRVDYIVRGRAAFSQG